MQEMAERTAPLVRIVDGIGSLVADYDIYLLDQWGVIHDGVTLHPGALDAMEKLAAAGKRTIILSNSGKRASDSHGRLDSLGVNRALYLEIITSGELVYRNLAKRTDPFYAALGPRFLMFAWDTNRGIVEGTGFEEVDRIEAADFILCAGTDQQDLAYYEPALQAGLARGLPMICANPDRVSVQPDGSLKMCPGAIAEVYEKRGGKVRWHGKPTREVYEMCGEIAGGLDRAIGVGDSLIHDIKGANDAGIDSLLIIGGIHSEEVDRPLTPQSIGKLSDRYGARPTHAADLFKW